MDPLLVISNAGAGAVRRGVAGGGADAPPLARRRRGPGHVEPRRAQQRAAPRGVPADRRRRRRRQPARGRHHPLPPQRPQERGARHPAAGDRQRLRPDQRHPARRRGGGAGPRRRRAAARWTSSWTRSARSWSTTCTPAPGRRPAGSAPGGRTGSTRSGWVRSGWASSTSASSATRSAQPLAAVKPPFIRVAVEVDGEVVVDMDQPILMVAVGNGAQRRRRHRAHPARRPRGRPGRRDGLPVDRAAGAGSGYGAKLLTGRHPERDDVIYVRGSTVSVSGEEFWCSADGEIYGPERHRTWRVEPAAYSLVVPR